MSEEVIIALIAAVPGLLSLWLRSADSEKLKAEAATVYKKMAGEQSTQIAMMTRRLNYFGRVMERWRCGIELLVAQIKASGGTPVWIPEPLNENEEGEAENEDD